MHWGRGRGGKERVTNGVREKKNKNTINDFPVMDYILLFFE